jgi:hypothetical protein
MPVCRCLRAFLIQDGENHRISLPELGRARFYVLTAMGIFTAEASERDLGEGRSELSPLFHAGHRVITELRLVTQKE